MVVAVFPLRIRDHLVASVIGVVHVDIRRLRALGIEEPLERELVGQGVDVRDADRVGDKGACGRAACRREDTLMARERQQVSDDEEVRRESLIDNDLEFVLEALGDLW